MNASEKFSEDVIEIIRNRYPNALRGNIGENTEAANAVAVVLGGLLAFSFRLNGEVLGRTTLQSVVKKIIESAAAIDHKGAETIRKAMPTEH